jgi:CO/xanthine dehydrogenase Mo-binding subunit
MTTNESIYTRRFFSVFSQEEKDKVRGHAFFPSDHISALLPTGVARVVVLRSPHAGASFSRLELTKALQVPGVVKVISAKEVPNNMPFGGRRADGQLILADGSVRFKGEPVALVVAETLEAACKARDLIEVDWKPLQSEEKIVEKISYESGVKVDSAARSKFKFVETSFHYPSLHARFLEPESGWVLLQNDQLDFRIGSLLSESQRVWLSQVLGISVAAIKAQESYLGGQFGGRQQREMIVFLALASWLARRSCCLQFEYEEQDIGSYGYSGSLRIAYEPDSGRLAELSGELRIDSGSYEGNAASFLRMAMEHASGVYDFESVHLEGHVMTTPSFPRRAMKGEGMTAITWVTEQLIDQIANDLEISALEFRQSRLKNDPAIRTVFEETERVERPFRLITADRSRPLWDAKAIEGRGFAFQAFQASREKGFDEVEVSLELLNAGSFLIRCSNMTLDLHVKSALAEVAASVLKTHPKAFQVEGEMRIEFEKPRKRETYPEFYYLAQAVWYAADRLRTQLKRAGEEVFRSEQIDLEDGAIVDRQSKKKMGYRELAFTNNRKDLKASYTLEKFDKPHGCVAGAVSRVVVNPLTGELRVESVKVVVDAGPVIHRTGLEVEAESAAAWAMAALFCSTVERDQPIPTPVDGPEEVLFFPIDYPIHSYSDQPPEIFGSRGLPDVVMSVVLASLVTAIQEAKGMAMKEIPMSSAFMFPEKKSSSKIHTLSFKR